MARYTGPKDRLSRREGTDLFGKGLKLTRLTITPGVHGPKGPGRRPSQYGSQLREKQKVKRLYGVLEKQFRRYIGQAVRLKGNTGEALLFLLERRLDNVVYRLGFSTTRAGARQLVSHGHVRVDDKRVNIPSYQLKVGQTVSLGSKSAKVPSVTKAQKEEAKLPSWLEKKGPVGRVKAMPTRLDIVEPINEQDIVEFYSR